MKQVYNTWKEAALYEGDQMIYENVMHFLLDIGCQPKWSFDESGERIFISKVTYEGKEYDQRSKLRYRIRTSCRTYRKAQRQIRHGSAVNAPPI